MPSKRKKNEARKVKGKTAVSLSNPKTNLKVLLSMHSQTLQANILHLDQKASTSFKMHLLAKVPGVNGLKLLEKKRSGDKDLESHLVQGMELRTFLREGLTLTDCAYPCPWLIRMHNKL